MAKQVKQPGDDALLQQGNNAPGENYRNEQKNAHAAERVMPAAWACYRMGGVDLLNHSEQRYSMIENKR
jgi:hypothetical protein